MKQKAFFIQAGRSGAFASEWLEKSIVSIGLDSAGLELVGKTREQIREAYAEAHGSLSPQEIDGHVGMLDRFANEMTVGTMVVTYDPGLRLYHIGRVIGGCVPADKEMLDNGECLMRKVSWESGAPCDLLDTMTENSLRGISALSSISGETLGELQSAANAQPDATPNAAPSVTPNVAPSVTPNAAPSVTPNVAQHVTPPVKSVDDEEDDDVDNAPAVISEDEAMERIKDRVREFGWEDMELLVAGLLRAMGYKTYMTQKGADGGRDIIASPDGFGLVQPRIVAEVKHRQELMDSGGVRAFVGTLRNSDSGLYVCTGGFTEDARLEAQRATRPVHLLDLDQLVRAIVERYDNADDEMRRLLPLVRIYLPA